MSLELAEQSIQLLTCHLSRWRLCHRSPQDNQSKSWKKCGLCFLSLITSHAFSTSRAEHATSYMSYKQMKTLSSFTTRQPIEILKKSVTSVFLSLITSHAVSTSRAKHTTSYMSCKQMKTSSSFTARQPIQISGKGVTSGCLSLGMVSMTPGNSLFLVNIRLGISSKA
jgi:hypothetical protein